MYNCSILSVGKNIENLKIAILMTDHCVKKLPSLLMVCSLLCYRNVVMCILICNKIVLLKCVHFE